MYIVRGWGYNSSLSALGITCVPSLVISSSVQIKCALSQINVFPHEQLKFGCVRDQSNAIFSRYIV
jgi:hypothetical protein